MTEAKIDTYVKNLTNEKWGKIYISKRQEINYIL